MCLTGFSAYAQSPVTLYFTNDALGTNIWTLSQVSPAGPSVSTTTASNAASTTGWYHLDPGLSDSTNEASEPSNTAPGWNTIWVSADSFSGDFAAGNWVLTVRKTDNRSARVGVFHADIYSATSQTNQASGATLIAHCSSVGDSWTGAAATITATCTTAGVTTLSNKYLAIRTLAQVSTGSTSSGAYTVIIGDTTNGLTKMVTPNYTASRQDVSRAPANHTVNMATSVARKLGINPTDSASLDFACTVGTCVDLNTPFSQPTINFATSITRTREMHANAAITLGFNTGSPTADKTVAGGSNFPRGAAGSLNLACTTCTDLTRSFLQPTINFATSADRVKSTAGGQSVSRSANVSLSFATSTCIDLTRGNLSVSMGLATKATYCMERSFPLTNLTFATTAAAYKTGSNSKTGSAGLNVATSANVRRALNRIGNASLTFTTLDARLANRPRSDNSNVAFATTVATKVAKVRAGNATFNMALGLSRVRNTFKTDNATVTFTTSTVIRRDLHVAATASVNLNTGNPSAVRATVAMPWFRGAPGTVTVTTGVAIQRALHTVANASVNLATSDVRLVARTRTDATNLNVAPLVSVQRAMHVSASANLNFNVGVTAVISQTTRRRVVIIGAM